MFARTVWVLAGVCLISAFQAKAQQDTDSPQDEAMRSRASVYVPLDSWVYPVFDRLIAAQYVDTASQMNRPWTRLECARLLAEAKVHARAPEQSDELIEMIGSLNSEFSSETAVLSGNRNVEARVESVYSRTTLIAGTPLRDGYNFGQTIVNDFGRPYGQGANQISGMALRASAGRFAFYLRGEGQYAQPAAPYNTSAQQAIMQYNNTLLSGGGMPYDWNLRLTTTNRLRTVEAYATATLANWQFSFGQQSLWWGPNRTTSLILSNNAEAMPMIRFNRVKPAQMPGILRVLGPTHFDAFFARQGGIHYVGLGQNFTLYGSPSQALKPPPYLWGVHFSFQPTKALEFGFGHTTIFAGYGRPLNLRTFLHTFSNDGNGQEIDPGKRVTSFDFTYHVPGLRDRVLLYTEGMAWDNPIQGKFVGRFAFAPGIYIPALPHLKRMDFRAEGAYTDLPKLPYPGYFYSNAHYSQGYTNYGQILGSWVGRQGRGGQASTTYWFTPQKTLTASYRKVSVDKAMLMGGTMEEFSSNFRWFVKPTVEVTAGGQYERWKFLLLQPTPKSNFVTTFGIQFHPSTTLHPK